MKTIANNRVMLMGASLAVLAWPAIALAAEPAADAQAGEGPSANEIVVTATRQAQKLQDVAMSVNVATGEQLEKFKIFDAKDIQQLAPGLELTNTTGRNNTTTLRGVTFDPDQGTGPAVQVYVNEIPTDAQTAYTAIYDIEQINVLRGPQGLLRGLSAPAGSITFATRRPSFDTIEGFIQGTATDRAGYNVQGGVSLPFSDKVALRVSGLVDGNRLNHVTNVNTGGKSRSRTESARVTLGLKPTDNFSAFLTYQYLTADNTQYQQVAGAGNTPSYGLLALLGFAPPYVPGTLVADTTERSGPALGVSDYAAVSEGTFRSRNNTHVVNLAMDYDFGPATLSFVGAHQQSTIDIQRDLDPGNAVPNYVDASALKVPYNVDTAELRLASNNDEGLGWGIGAFYTNQTGLTVVDQRADNFFFPTSAATSQFILGDVNYQPVGVHVEVPVNSSTWSFNANLRFKSGPLKIEGGIRHSIIKSIQSTTTDVTIGYNAVSGFGPLVLSNTQGATMRKTPWTGGANISYELSPTLNAYAAYGHSFRAGSTAVSTPVGISDDLVTTRDETTDSWELGFKGSAFDRRVSFSVAGFYQKLNGFLSRLPGIYYSCPQFFGSCFTSPPAPAADSAPDGAFDFNYNGDATIKGVEASIDARLTRNWDLGVAASYVKARYDDALLPCNDFDGSGRPNQNGAPTITGGGNVSYCRSSDRLSDTPDFNLTANTELRLPMGSVTPFIGALFTYRPGFYSSRVDYAYQDRELLNLFVGVRSDDSKWELTAFARNLLNQQRVTNISLGTAQRSTAAGVPFDSGYYLINTTTPREFGATLKFSW